VKLATAAPEGVNLSSGSAVRVPVIVRVAVQAGPEVDPRRNAVVIGTAIGGVTTRWRGERCHARDARYLQVGENIRRLEKFQTFQDR
jgi:hypothetical protein